MVAVIAVSVAIVSGDPIWAVPAMACRRVKSPVIRRSASTCVIAISGILDTPHRAAWVTYLVVSVVTFLLISASTPLSGLWILLVVVSILAVAALNLLKNREGDALGLPVAIAGWFRALRALELFCPRFGICPRRQLSGALWLRRARTGLRMRAACVPASARPPRAGKDGPSSLGIRSAGFARANS